jgi:hypothetical protein
MMFSNWRLKKMKQDIHVKTNLVRGIWEEELERSRRILEAKKGQLAKLPKGSIHKKKIRNGVYYYLYYRDKDRVRAEYIGNDPVKVKKLQEEIASRKALELSIRRSREDIRLLERAARLK